ncbi:MAG: BON domain-containing protein [Hydrogenophaga sp.]|jgi:osmotically-inducible protein OsmY|uniref:BON domain-containing protein n=1 Tax=Hydrogenophaga sp. TaxID=1904254 RepID=UPI0025C58062|nr:BON domain-containing protein [Hydrogenophaga sp.]MDO8887137.1 BON domain-containing protein [Hydrogenophaga sp.]MDO9133546.1 BON domain-containing protein [Hydrogenophaga sp.]MDO9504209.1 BON domain-containing protein [Hydrogenophaga sp.]MDP1686617.1 BON domain-containing protein [Hydrogenophaga sp.]MDP1780390.1 BON domain-containing protein [Hydrogenophaga sp.]
MKPTASPRLQRITVATLLVAALGATLSACAPLVVGGAAVGALVAVDRRTSGAQLDDQGIELRSNNRLKDELGDARARVAVTSYNRRVLLTGEAASEAVKTQITQIVSGVSNVREVINELGVTNSPTLKERATDTLITGRLKASLVDAKDLAASAFKVVTERGTVYLMGRVTQREADRATDLARNTPGVSRVVRTFEIITEQELANMQPRPAANESK